MPIEPLEPRERMEIGRIEGLYRYPVKSMRGESLDAAALGWHGLDGDRRFALRRLEKRGGFPWLSASKLPELVLFTPERAAVARDALPTHVRTPDGESLPVMGEALTAEIGRRLGSPVEMMHLRDGIFDDASVSVILSDTIRELARLSETVADARRFRPNVVVAPSGESGVAPFAEDRWVGGTLRFGDGDDAATVSVTQRDLRCVMIDIDPDTAQLAPSLFQSVTRVNDAYAGVYATVTRVGRLAVGQRVWFEPAR